MDRCELKKGKIFDLHLFLCINIVEDITNQKI